MGIQWVCMNSLTTPLGVNRFRRKQKGRAVEWLTLGVGDTVRYRGVEVFVVANANIPDEILDKVSEGKYVIERRKKKNWVLPMSGFVSAINELRETVRLMKTTYGAASVHCSLGGWGDEFPEKTFDMVGVASQMLSTIESRAFATDFGCCGISDDGNRTQQVMVVKLGNMGTEDIHRPKFVVTQLKSVADYAMELLISTQPNKRAVKPGWTYPFRAGAWWCLVFDLAFLAKTNPKRMPSGQKASSFDAFEFKIQDTESGLAWIGSHDDAWRAVDLLADRLVANALDAIAIL